MNKLYIKFYCLFRKLTKNTFNIEESFSIQKSRGWDKTFWFFDIHGTILKPDYDNLAIEYYPYAKETLQKISKRTDISMILYTCSKPEEIEIYLEMFQKDGINFQYYNENPEASDTKHGCFQSKPYMNVLLEDKAGFRGEYDWYYINKLLDKY